jgi:transcription elongation factor Elf1
MSKKQALTALVKVAKLQEKLLKKLASEKDKCYRCGSEDFGPSHVHHMRWTDLGMKRICRDCNDKEDKEIYGKKKFDCKYCGKEKSVSYERNKMDFGCDECMSDEDFFDDHGEIKKKRIDE